MREGEYHKRPSPLEVVVPIRFYHRSGVGHKAMGNWSKCRSITVDGVLVEHSNDDVDLYKFEFSTLDKAEHFVDCVYECVREGKVA